MLHCKNKWTELVQIELSANGQKIIVIEHSLTQCNKHAKNMFKKSYHHFQLPFTNNLDEHS